MKRVTHLARAVAKMPPLRHSVPGLAFDPLKSEVIDWICATPEGRQFLFDQVKSRGLIAYNAESGMWTGVPVKEEEISNG